VQRGLASSSIANGLPPPESQLHTHRGRLQLVVARAGGMDDDRACTMLRYAMDDVLRSGLSLRRRGDRAAARPPAAEAGGPPAAGGGGAATPRPAAPWRRPRGKTTTTPRDSTWGNPPTRP
jgi:hypothetical protein